MNVSDIIRSAYEQGVFLSVAEGRLKYTTKKDGLTAALREQLRAHKQAIIDHLQAEQAARASDAPTALGNDAAQPLSFGQQRLWFLHKMMGPNAVYNIAAAFELDDSVDVVALGNAVGRLIERHAALRTRFVLEDGDVVQRANTGADPIDVQDVATKAQMQERISAERGYCFDLEHDPLSRFCLLNCLESGQRVLTVTLHHAIADGASMGVLLDDLSGLLLCESGRAPAQLVDLPYQYADYAAWERRCATGPRADEALGYWRNALRGLPELLELPTDRPRPAKQSFAGQTLGFTLEAATAKRVRALAAERGVTLFTALNAAFAVLLSRYSHQRQIAIGTPVANRQTADAERLIGFFANTLVLSHDLSDDPTFDALLARAHEMCMGAFAAQDLPFDRLVEELRPARSLSHSPLFQVMFSMQTGASKLAEMGSCGLAPYVEDSAATRQENGSRFDMTWSVADHADGTIELSIEYASALFDAATIQQLVAHYDTLLQAVCDDPQQTVLKIPLAEAAPTLDRTSTASDVQALFVHALFERHSVAQPDAIALSMRDDDGLVCQVSYAELNARANALAHWLRARGAGPESRIALCFERSLDAVIAILGTLKSGAAYVPVDVNNPLARMRHIVTDSGAMAILVQARAMALREDLRALVEDTATPVLTFDQHALVSGDLAPMPKDNIAPCDVGLSGGSLAYIIYTSGTTGLPKGVLVEHRNLPRLFSSTQARFAFGPDDVWTLFHSCAFDFSVWEMWGALAYRGRLVVVSEKTARSVDDFYRLLVEESVTFLNQTPTVFGRVVDADVRHRQPLALRCVVFGGEALDLRVLEPWFERHAPDAPSLINMYGITETTVHVTHRTIAPADLDNGLAQSIGRPIDDLYVVLLDENGMAVPRGVVGEIHVGGAGVARGYHERDFLTRERFVRVGPNASSALYKSGDLARYLPNGELEYIGRADSQVKLRGFRIELGEIANAMKAHSCVADAAAHVVCNALGEKQIVGYLVKNANAQNDSDWVSDVRAAVAEQLPAYMRPADFVTLEALPTTVNGKLDRAALPAPGATGSSEQSEPPATGTERALAALWGELLNCADVGRNDNFFARGGHSLLVAQLADRVRDGFDVTLSIEALFDAQSLAEQAALIDRCEGERCALPEVVRQALDPEDPTYAMSLGQERLWFMNDFIGDDCVYNIPLAVRFGAEVTADVLIDALGAVIAQHEGLRARYIATDDGARMRVDAQMPRIVAESVDGDAQLLEIATAERRRPFQLASDGLARFRVVVDRASGGVALLATWHHSVADGWSVGVFFDDLCAALSALRDDQSPSFDAPALHYRDFAAWERAWVDSPSHGRHMDYWQARLRGVPSALTLPTDRRRPARQSFAGKFEPVQLSPDVAQGVLALARQTDTTPFMVLISAWSILLSRFAAQSDVVVGTPIANRRLPGSDAVVGYFSNTLPLRFEIDEDRSFADYLAGVRQNLLRDYAHQGVSFERLVDAVVPERDASRAPLFQAMFALQNLPTGSQQAADFEVTPLREHLAACLDDGVTLEDGVARFDLTMTLHESDGAFSGGLEYNTDVFERATAKRLIAHFATLIERLVNANSRPLSEVSSVSAQALANTLAGAQLSSVAPSDQSLLDVLEVYATDSPGALALVVEDEGGCAQSLSYGELAARSDALAGQLLDAGVAPGNRVLLHTERADAAAVALFAAWKVAACAAPLDPQAPRLARLGLIDCAKPAAVLCDPSTRDQALELIGDGCPVLDTGPAADAVSTAAAFSRVAGSADAGAWRLARDGAAPAAHETFSHARLSRLLHGQPDAQGIAALAGANRAQRAALLAAHSVLCGAPEPVAALTPDVTPLRIPAQRKLVLDAQGRCVPDGCRGGLYLVAGPAALSAEWTEASDAVKHAAVGTGQTALALADGQIELGSPVAWCDDENAKLPRALDALDARLRENLQDDDVYLRGPGTAWTALCDVTCYVVGDVEHSDDIEKALIKQLVHGALLVPLPNVVMAVDALPRTSDGRVDEKKLPLRRRRGPAFVAPQTPVETALCELWQAHLGIESVGLDDNYFSLGGDSIRSLALVNEARERGYALSTKDLFACPSVRALAELVATRDPASVEVPAVEPFALLTEAETEALSASVDLPTLEDAFPLSMMQQGMLTLALREPELNLYENLQIYRMRFAWSREAFEGALGDLLARHPMLRSRYVLGGERPIQLVPREARVALEVVEVSADQDHDALVQAWMAAERERGLDTERELWRCTVHTSADGFFDFGLFVHHAMWDGWSLESFVSELHTAYAARLAGRNAFADAAELPSFAQYLTLETEALASASQRDFWAAQLREARLPWWTAKPKAPSEHLICDISREQSRRICELADELGVQEKSIWCAVYLTLLSMLDGSSDVTGCAITQGRPEIAGGDQMVGLFLNALPLRGRLAGESWSSFVRGVDEMLRHQHACRHYPVAQIQKDAGVELSGSLFTYTNWHVYDAVDNDDSQAHAPDKVGGFAETNYALSVIAFKDGHSGQFGLSVHADTGVFDATLRERMGGYASRIIDAMLATPQAAIDRTQLLGRDERAALLDTGRVEMPAQAPTVLAAFEQWAASNPEAVALTFEQTQLTYRELQLRAQAVALRLIDGGVQRGDRVTLYLSRSEHWLVSILGVMMAGAAYVPVDASQPVERLSFIVADSGSQQVVVDATTCARLTKSAAAKLSAQLVRIDQSERGGVASCADLAAIAVGPADLAYIIYTSGTTGRPKGVQIEHGNVARLFSCCAEEFAFNQDDVWTLFHSIAFDFSVWEIWGALAHGARLVLVSDQLARAPELFYDVLVDQKVTFLNQTPTVFRQVDAVDADKRQTLALRRVVFGGEALDVGSLASWFERHDDDDVQLVNMYGITETTVHVTYRRLTSMDAVPGAPSLVGRPLRDLEVYLLDDAGALVPTGIAGEICVGGAGLARGYLQRPELDRERFVVHPFRSGERLYRSGDLARFCANGELEYLGRVDNQVKIRGYRIELGEIESVLRKVDGVETLFVQVNADDSGHKRLLAYFVAAEECTGSEVALRLKNQAADALPDYMIPAAFVPLDAVPLTVNGKVDQAALPKPERMSLLTPYTAPRNDTERRLCAAWTAVLDVDNVGIDDNFFALGGDSILAVRAVAKARERGVEITIRDLFKWPTVSGLAAVAQSSHGQAQEVKPFELLTPEQRKLINVDSGVLADAYPMSELQLAMVFRSELDGASLDYRNIMSLEVLAPWNEAAFVTAVDALILRYPALRTTFRMDLPDPLQVVHHSVPAPLMTIDISDRSEQEQNECVQHWFEMAKAYEFDWNNPLFSLAVFVRSESSFQFCHLHHHALYDGWSDATFVAELFRTYQNVIDGASLATDSEDTAYRHFVALERQALTSPESRLFWESLLEEAPRNQIPVRRVDSDAEGDRVTEKFKIEGLEEHGSKLVQLAKTLGVPLQVLLLAAHCKVVSAVSGQSRVSSSVVLNGRPEQEGGSAGLGLFLNAAPMCFNVIDDSWNSLIRQINKILGDCLEHRWYPATAVQRRLGREFDELLFNYGHFHALSDLPEQSSVGFRNFQGFEQTDHPLAVHFVRAATGDQIDGFLAFDPSLYDPDLITQMARFYVRALAALVRDPAARPSSAGVMTDADARELRLLGATQPTAAAQCVHERVAQAACASPNAVALTAADANGTAQTWTYGWLDGRANQLANHLVACGIESEARVALALPRGADYVVAVLAILKAGGVYVPLDLAQPKERLQVILNDAAPQMLIVDAAAERAPTFAGPTVDLSQWPDAVAALPATAPDVSVVAQNACYMQYTSGSSGRPKGVIGTHAAVANRLHWYANAAGVTPQDVFCQKTSVSFVDHIAELFQPLSCGASLAMLPNDALLEPATFISALNEFKVTHLTVVPSFLNALLSFASDRSSVPSLRVLNCSGEALRLASRGALVKCCPNARLVNIYGSTEVGADATSSSVALSAGQDGRSDIGLPIDNLRAYVLNDRMEQVPAGCTGELYIGGPGLARGYFGQAALTAGAFVPDPFVDADNAGARMYRTGDLVQLIAARDGQDARLLYIGRKDRQVKIRGARVELGEVEAAVRTSAIVDNVAATFRSGNNGESVLVAYVVASTRIAPEDEVTTAAQIRQDLEARLPAFAQPEFIVFIDALPLNASGKTDYQRLPRVDLERIDRPYRAPEGEIEQTLAQLWQEALGLVRVGRDDNFFSAGGHSIAAIQMITKVNATFGVNFRVGDLFSNPTPESLGRQLALLQRITDQGFLESLSEDDAAKLLSRLTP